MVISVEHGPVLEKLLSDWCMSLLHPHPSSEHQAWRSPKTFVSLEELPRHKALLEADFAMIGRAATALPLLLVSGSVAHVYSGRACVKAGRVGMNALSIWTRRFFL